MKKRTKKLFVISLCLLTAFALWTVAVSFVDVKAIGPQNSQVGFATLNGFVRNLIGVNFTLYKVTDWLGLVPIAVASCFAVLGLIQSIERKNPFKADKDILILGGFYIAVIAAYILFEKVVINYRPVLIEGILEASYPSSTTMLVTCVMPTAVMQFNSRINNITLRRFINAVTIAFIIFMTVGRLISGVHWFTDIVGGALLSAGLVTAYYALTQIKEK